MYLAYGASESKIISSKKNADSFTLFKSTIMKIILLSLVYLYIGLGIYFTFDNARFIPDTSLIAAAFIVGLALDVLLIDTAYGMLTSLFVKKDIRLAEDSQNSSQVPM